MLKNARVITPKHEGRVRPGVPTSTLAKVLRWVYGKNPCQVNSGKQAVNMKTIGGRVRHCCHGEFLNTTTVRFYNVQCGGGSIVQK